MEINSREFDKRQRKAQSISACGGITTLMFEAGYEEWLPVRPLGTWKRRRIGTFNEFEDVGPRRR